MVEIRPGEKVAVLTGAGVSAESGVMTFRDSGGLWETHSIEEVATPEGFSRNPQLVWRFYNQRRNKLWDVRPNPGHRALAEMEARLGERFHLVTQNVDDLHERAGSRKVIHMHGEISKVRCLACGVVYEDRTDLPDTPLCSQCRGPLRPSVVWFGEMPLFLEEIQETLLKCDLFLAVGTSGTVYPAAQFIQIAKAGGARTVCINPDPEANTPFADVFICQKAGIALPELLREALG